MVEVFRTNVKDHQHAVMLKAKIKKVFGEYEINFDLQDCDKILRVKCVSGSIQVSSVIELMHQHGFYAEIL